MGVKFNTILTTGVALAFIGGINYVSYKDAQSEYLENIKPQIETSSDSIIPKKKLEEYIIQYETEKRQNIDSLEYLVRENLENENHKLISKYAGKAVKMVDYMATPGRRCFIYEKIHEKELREKYLKIKNSLFNKKINNSFKQ